MLAVHGAAPPAVSVTELRLPPGGQTGFVRVPPEQSGVTFTNHLAEENLVRNRILANGSGVALGDVDGDGWCDLYFCRLEGGNALYRNLGQWRFADITGPAGVACPGQNSMGAALADVDGDDDLDLLVTGLGAGTRLFRNDGTGRFTEATDSGLRRKGGATSLALADFDGDGDLDLYVAHYRTDTWKDRPPGLNVEVRLVNGEIRVTPPGRFIPVAQRSGGVELSELGEPDIFYLNDGRGHFSAVPWEGGVFRDETNRPLRQPPMDWGLSVWFRDLNGDRLPDLLLCDDFFFSLDRVWIHQPGDCFRPLNPLAIRHTSVSSMGGDVADFNRDGHFDFFVSDMVSRRQSWRQRQRPQLMQGVVRQKVENPAARPEVPHNTLQLSRGDGTFAEIAQLAGVDFSEWSWGGLFLDVDLDGWEDLVIPTGSSHDMQDADAFEMGQRLRQLPDTLENRLRGWRNFAPLKTPLVAFRNRHDLTFEDVSAAWGFTEPGVWQGMAFADLDRDGDLDAVVNQLNGPAGLFRNDCPAPRVAVRLRGKAPNTRGIGALIRVTGGPVAQMQEMIEAGRYLSDDDDVRVFAAGAPTHELRIEVTWRDGRQSVVTNARPNRLYTIAQTGARPAPAAPPEKITPWFQVAATCTNAGNPKNPFDDFARQPLLSRKPSTLGPGVGWWDADGDGRAELLLQSRWGGAPALWQTRPETGFQDVSAARLGPPLHGHMGGALGLRDGQGRRAVLTAGMAAEGGRPVTRLWWLRPAGAQPASGNLELSGIPGPLAAGDLDGDGTLELFVGAQSYPGRYPVPGRSRLLRRQGDQWKRDSRADPLFGGLGPVNDACFADLTGDGLPELIVACDWGPLRLWRNAGGRLQTWDPPTRPEGKISPHPALAGETPLSRLTGWWNSVAVGDFDEDGRLDLVAGNWGRNTRFQRHLTRPIRLYVGDFTEDGVVDLIDAWYDDAQGKYVPWRPFEVVRRELPALNAVATTYRQYSKLGVDSLLGLYETSVLIREAAVLDSLLLLNRGDHFVTRSLPVAAQLAPVFGMAAADFDGDGHEDLFVAQNYFGVEPETTRYDAGRGLLLRGDGKGGFQPVDARHSGIALYGEQRGCAVADYDADGRLDLAVGHVDGRAVVFHRTGGPAGVRVRLAGPPGNPDGWGAVVRLLGRDGQPRGPARTRTCGGGLWSQPDPVLVVPADPRAARIEIRWPGGARGEAALPAHAREITLRFPRN